MKDFVKAMLLSAERADYVVEPIKSRDAVPQTIVSVSTLAMWTHFPPKLHDVTFGRHSNALSDAVFHFQISFQCLGITYFLWNMLWLIV